MEFNAFKTKELPTEIKDAPTVPALSEVLYFLIDILAELFYVFIEIS